MQDLEEVQSIKRSLPPCASPIAVVHGKCSRGSPVQETKILCAHYRKLNTQLPTELGSKSTGVITLVDILITDEILACLCDSKFFTS